MFTMDAKQFDAAKNAMDGFSAQTFSQIIHVLIAAFVLVWFFCIFLSLWQSLHERRIDFGDALGQFSLAVFTLICAAIFIVC